MYTVVAGDTGNAIAAAYGITFAELDAFNPGVNWYNLQIGQTLLVPAPGVPATSIAGSANTASLEQGATVPATRTSSSCGSTTTTITVSSTVTMPAVTNEPSPPSTARLSENTSTVVPVPANTNEKSAFLNPGGADISARSVGDQNSTMPKPIKLRLVRNEQATDTDSASQPQEPQHAADPDLRPSATSSTPEPSHRTYELGGAIVNRLEPLVPSRAASVRIQTS